MLAVNEKKSVIGVHTKHKFYIRLLKFSLHYKLINFTAKFSLLNINNNI